MPLLTTTTVRGQTAATRSISSSCAPGSASVLAVVALALVALRGADHDHRRVRARGRRDGLGEHLAAPRTRTAASRKRTNSGSVLAGSAEASTGSVDRPSDSRSAAVSKGCEKATMTSAGGAASLRSPRPPSSSRRSVPRPATAKR